ALYQLEILDTPAEKPFDDIVAVAAALCDTPIAIINFVDADRQWGKALVGLESSEAPRAASFCAQTIAQESGTLVVPDTLGDPAWSGNPQVAGPPGLRFYAGAAIVTDEGHALGSLCVADDQRPREFGARELEGLRSLARQTGELLKLRDRSIKLSKANEQLRDLAVRDPLTNLPNRTFLEDSLALALSQRLRSGRDLGLLLCDLDDFKFVNDEYGHQAGDRMLQVVAERLTGAAREADLVARLGGDEFVVLCPELSGADDLVRIAQRLGEAVAAPVALAGTEFEPRLSIGPALAADGDWPEDLLARADKAMYRAKRHS
ncbi:MAG: sensor domain-containing diguanylate cyclase, partial [Solirubrobacteraceae bacterium]